MRGLCTSPQNREGHLQPPPRDCVMGFKSPEPPRGAKMAGKQQGPAAAPCPVVVPAPWCPPLRPPVPRGARVGVPGDKRWEHMVYDLVPPPWGLSLESDGGTDKGTAGHSWQRKGTSSPDAPAGTVWRFPRRSCHTGSPPAPRPRSDPLAGFIFLFQRTAADPVPEALAGWGGRGERSA